MPVITKPNQHFDTTTYTGNGGTQSITSLGFQPDFVWVKSRSTGSTNHLLEDVIRGTKNSLISNGNNAELARGINAFLSNGFSFNDDASGDGNVNSQTYVAWNWKAGGAAVTNTSGSITSQVSANPTAGFSIVKINASGSSGSIGHGLGVAPSMIIGKNTAGADDWYTYHASIGTGAFIRLNTTAAQASSASAYTNINSTTFTAGSGVLSNNAHIFYCFAQVAGYSAFGSYVGNDSADGTFIYTGFRPAFILYKKATGIDGWVIFDVKRNTYNVVDTALQPNTTGAEASSAAGSLDILSNGFKQRNANNIANSSSFTYIYMAFAEAPFKYANAR